MKLVNTRINSTLLNLSELFYKFPSVNIKPCLPLILHICILLKKHSKKKHLKHNNVNVNIVEYYIVENQGSKRLITSSRKKYCLS